MGVITIGVELSKLLLRSVLIITFKNPIHKKRIKPVILLQKPLAIGFRHSPFAIRQFALRSKSRDLIRP